MKTSINNQIDAINFALGKIISEWAIECIFNPEKASQLNTCKQGLQDAVSSLIVLKTFVHDRKTKEGSKSNRLSDKTKR